MDFNTFKAAVARAAEAQGVTEYELYYLSSEDTGVEAFKHEINEFTSSVEGGVCFRCIRDGRMGYASTEELSDEQAVSLVRRAADNAATLESDEGAFLVEGGQTYETHEQETYPLPDAAALTRTALQMQDLLLAADPAVLDNSQSAASAGKTTVSICNSKGLDVSFTAAQATVMAMPIVGNGQEMTNSYETRHGDFAKIDLNGAVQKAVGDAKAKLGGDVPPTGVMPVVFAPEAMASLLATFCPNFSSENVQKGLSRLGGKEGEAIASPAVTLVDDPFHKDSPMPVPFDAEGSPAHCKNVIENGVLKTLLYNLQTAAKAGKATTGNAAKAGYASKVGVRPFTFYVAPGGMSEDELLQKAGNGVYINMLGGLHAGANVISGDFSLQSGGFMIENGKKTTPVKSFTVAGNFYDVLRNVTDVAANLEVPHARGITNFGSPSVLVTGLSVAGK